MILISFSSAEDVLSNDVKKCDIFSSQSTENPPFCFFWDTRYSFLLTSQFIYHFNKFIYLLYFTRLF